VLVQVGQPDTGDGSQSEPHLIGLSGLPIPDTWIQHWRGRVGVSLAAYSGISPDEPVARTLAVTSGL